MDARRHVNKMCLAVDVPLIESGTTGFKGQVQVIKKGKTACYDCSPKTTPISYPVCTIRSTPSQPIHCIVWGKSYLLPELFGLGEDETPDLDNTEDSENAAEIQKLKEEAQALKKIRQSIGSDDFSRQIFDKVFNQDIERLAKMEDMWKERKPPTPLSYDTLEQQSADIDPSISTESQKTWSVPENFVVFKDSLSRLSKRLAEDQAIADKTNQPRPIITFDKDDDDTMDFVTASGNLRASIFGIEAKSKFDTKQMAGNIIPAIATTNAMVAGLCVLQAFKVIKGEYARTKWLWLWNGSLRTDQLEKPNPECVVCSVAMTRVNIDLDKATLGDLVQNILKTSFSYSDEITVMTEAGIIYDPDLEDNLEKKLVDLGIGDASFIVVKDEEDDTPRVDLQLAVVAVKAEDGRPAVTLVQREGETFEIPRKPEKAPLPEAAESDTDDVEIVVNGTAPITAKRKRALSDADANGTETPAKKLPGAVTKGPSSKAVLVDEDDGTLLIADD